jgi:diguanylate cyclase (GGDEF)-like protein
MLLSRDDILAIYGSEGREALQLLTDRPARKDDSETSVMGADNGETHTGGAHEASLHEDEDADQGDGAPDARVRRELERQRRLLANQDALTGLSNRGRLQKQLGKAVLEAKRSGSKVAFVLMDLDRFRDINNSLGHRTGDTILINVARKIRSLVKASDAVGRFGGDEFGVILKNLALDEDIAPTLTELIDGIAAIILARTPALHSGASLGAALYPDHAAEAGDLIQNAEIALYQAKAEGSRQARFFDSKMKAALTSRLEELSAFRTALETGHLKAYYQPQMRLSDRRSHGFEALARWILPNGDVLYPGNFQVSLNDPDAAVSLGEHMLRSISDDLRQWHDTGMPTCKVSVNVTAPELTRGDYPKKVAEIFGSKGIPLSQLTVEITESVLLGDRNSRVAQALFQLRDLGVSIALDDFGTGFASLTHLKSYAIDQIKIDRSFVSELAFNAGDRAIVRATLSLAKNLRIETVAEGIEDEMQLKFLQSLGCDYAQGFLFSQAVPADEAEAYFRQHRAYRRAQLHQFVLTSAVA